MLHECSFEAQRFKSLVSINPFTRNQKRCLVAQLKISLHNKHSNLAELDYFDTAASELRVNSAGFEMQENDQIIREKQRPFVLRA